MELLIFMGLLACFLCPSLIVLGLVILILCAFYSVVGVAVFIPIIGLVIAGWAGSLFDPYVEKKKKEYEKACNTYDEAIFRLYHADEYWEQQRKKQKKPSKETVAYCKRVLAEQKRRESMTLPIAKDYLKRKG